MTDLGDTLLDAIFLREEEKDKVPWESLPQRTLIGVQFSLLGLSFILCIFLRGALYIFKNYWNRQRTSSRTLTSQASGQYDLQSSQASAHHHSRQSPPVSSRSILLVKRISRKIMSFRENVNFITADDGGTQTRSGTIAADFQESLHEVRSPRGIDLQRRFSMPKLGISPGDFGLNKTRYLKTTVTAGDLPSVLKQDVDISRRSKQTGSIDYLCLSQPSADSYVARSRSTDGPQDFQVKTHDGFCVRHRDQETSVIFRRSLTRSSLVCSAPRIKNDASHGPRHTQSSEYINISDYEGQTSPISIMTSGSSLDITITDKTHTNSRRQNLNLERKAESSENSSSLSAEENLTRKMSSNSDFHGAKCLNKNDRDSSPADKLQKSTRLEEYGFNSRAEDCSNVSTCPCCHHTSKIPAWNEDHSNSKNPPNCSMSFINRDSSEYSTDPASALTTSGHVPIHTIHQCLRPGQLSPTSGMDLEYRKPRSMKYGDPHKIIRPYGFSRNSVETINKRIVMPHFQRHQSGIARPKKSRNKTLPWQVSAQSQAQKDMQHRRKDKNASRRHTVNNAYRFSGLQQRNDSVLSKQKRQTRYGHKSLNKNGMPKSEENTYDRVKHHPKGKVNIGCTPLEYFTSSAWPSVTPYEMDYGCFYHKPVRDCLFCNTVTTASTNIRRGESKRAANSICSALSRDFSSKQQGLREIWDPGRKQQDFKSQYMYMHMHGNTFGILPYSNPPKLYEPWPLKNPWAKGIYHSEYEMASHGSSNKDAISRCTAQGVTDKHSQTTLLQGATAHKERAVKLGRDPLVKQTRFKFNLDSNDPHCSEGGYRPDSKDGLSGNNNSEQEFSGCSLEFKLSICGCSHPKTQHKSSEHRNTTTESRLLSK